MSEKRQKLKRAGLVLGVAGMTVLFFCGWVYLTGWSYQRAERERVQKESQLPPPEGEQQAANPNPVAYEEESKESEESSAAGGYPYIARFYQDHIGIFDSAGQLVDEIHIRKGLLNEQDQLQLQQGIRIEGEKEYIQLLESFSD